MDDVIKKGFRDFAERCRIRLVPVCGKSTADLIVGLLLDDYNALREVNEEEGELFIELQNIKEDLLHSLALHPFFEKDENNMVLLNNLWEMVREEKIIEIDERHRGERGGGEPLEFKKPK